MKQNETTFNGYLLKDQFFIDGKQKMVEDLMVKGDKIYLKLKEPYSGKKITYLPNYRYPGTEICNQGPWLFGKNDIGALSFHNYQIKDKR